MFSQVTKYQYQYNRNNLSNISKIMFSQVTKYQYHEAFLNNISNINLDIIMYKSNKNI